MLSGETSDDENGIMEKLIIEEVFLVRSKEEIVIEGKEIILNDDIYCEGKLTLKDCVLVYNGDNIQGRVFLYGDNSILLLSNCTIVGKNNSKRNSQSDRWLIINESGPNASEMPGSSEYKKLSFFTSGNPKVTVERCNLVDCYNFIEGVETFIKDSIIHYTMLPVFSEKRYGSGIKQGIHFISGYDTSLEGCIIKGDKAEMASYNGDLIFGQVKNIKNCTVSNIANLCECSASDAGIQNSMFNNCSNIFTSTDIITDCVFENCTNIAEYSRVSKNTQFINCGGRLLAMPKSVSHCSFLNIQNPNPEDFDPRIQTTWSATIKSRIDGWGISLFRGGNTISHCVFDGINHEGFIRFGYETGFSFFGKNLIAYTISDCVFKHCVSNILDQKNYKEETKDAGISIINCTGLDDTSGGQAENPVANQKTESGEPIGATIEESEVGAPLYHSA